MELIHRFHVPLLTYFLSARYESATRLRLKRFLGSAGRRLLFNSTRARFYRPPAAACCARFRWALLHFQPGMRLRW